MRMGPVEQKIHDIVYPSVEDMGFHIVRIRLAGEGRGRALQVMIEPLDGSQLNVDGCADVSRTVSVLLEVDDPIDGAYNLEVSSTGVDRPLTRKQDFEKYIGQVAKIETDMLIEGRRRFRGDLVSVEDDNVKIEVDGVEYPVPLDRIVRAKLVLTDALLALYEASPGAVTV